MSFQIQITAAPSGEVNLKVRVTSIAFLCVASGSVLKSYFINRSSLSTLSRATLCVINFRTAFVSATGAIRVVDYGGIAFSHI